METKKVKRGAPPRYDEAFKAGAVRMVTEQGRPSTEVAKEPGICIDTLRSWLRSVGVQAGEANRENRDARCLRELEAENRSLRKKLGEKDVGNLPQRILRLASPQAGKPRGSKSRAAARSGNPA